MNTRGERIGVSPEGSYLFRTGGIALLAAVTPRRYPLSEVNRSGCRWIGQPGGLQCAGAQLPGREFVSYRSVTLGRASDRHGFRRAHRCSRRIHPAAAPLQNLLEPAALFGEGLRLATYIRPFDGDIANGSGQLRRLEKIESFQQHTLLQIAVKRDAKVMAHGPR